ncbi:MAG: phosphonate C-P lyase system protein PhnH [Bacillota bacterium]
MIFNEVSYTQSVFRKLLDCMSRPGSIEAIEPAPFKETVKLSNFSLGIALTLLDQETSFCVLNNTERTEEFIKVCTMAAIYDPEQCDYLFFDGKFYFNPGVLKKGTLAYCDESATVICQVKRLAGQEIKQPKAIRLSLTGPGIKDQKTLYIDGLHQDIPADWKKCNRDYPLGIDWIFHDKEGNICCIPRSSKFNWEVL